jgi:hypothetical protein
MDIMPTNEKLRNKVSRVTMAYGLWFVYQSILDDDCRRYENRQYAKYKFILSQRLTYRIGIVHARPFFINGLQIVRK